MISIYIRIQVIAKFKYILAATQMARTGPNSLTEKVMSNAPTDEPSPMDASMRWSELHTTSDINSVIQCSAFRRF